MIDLKYSYGIKCRQITPVIGGLLNQKWKVLTEQGDVFIKQYSMKRFNKNQMERIESALQRQVILEKNGVLCPFIWQSNGRIIRWLDDETAYMVMNFCTGKIETPQTITTIQMHNLGSVCAIMHNEFSKLTIPSVINLPHYGGYTVDSLWKYFNDSMTQCTPDTYDEYRNTLYAVETILKHIDNDFFNKFPQGYAHEDFHTGNILFDIDCVSAVIDFDRNCYSYIWHDIGRAILSFALCDGILNTEKVRAFIDGYSHHSPLTSSNIADALRLTWCIEIPWWIQPDFFGTCDIIPKRFKDEMIWLTNHWFEIESFL